MQSETSAVARSRFLYIRFLMRSFLRLPKKDSATALSHLLPRQLMLRFRVLLRQNRRQSSIWPCAALRNTRRHRCRRGR